MDQLVEDVGGQVKEGEARIPFRVSTKDWRDRVVERLELRSAEREEGGREQIIEVALAVKCIDVQRM